MPILDPAFWLSSGKLLKLDFIVNYAVSEKEDWTKGVTMLTRMAGGTLVDTI